MALMLGWYHPPFTRRWPEIFNDNDYCALTGMTLIDDSDEEYDDEDEPNQELASQGTGLHIMQKNILTKLLHATAVILFTFCSLISIA
jgi:hypothetical protein